MIAGRDSNSLNTVRMDFTVRRYDTFSETFEIQYYDSSGVLQTVDLTDAFAQMWVKKKKTDTAPVLVMDIAISGNELTISKDRSMMKLPAGRYYYDIEIKDVNLKNITWVEGRFTVLEHVTEWVNEKIYEFIEALTTFWNWIDVPVFRKLVGLTQTIAQTLEVIWIVRKFKPYLSNYLYTFNHLFEIRRYPIILRAALRWEEIKKYKYFQTFSMAVTDVSFLSMKSTLGMYMRLLSYRYDEEEMQWFLEYDSLSSEETP